MIFFMPNQSDIRIIAPRFPGSWISSRYKEMELLISENIMPLFFISIIASTRFGVLREEILSSSPGFSSWTLRCLVCIPSGKLFNHSGYAKIFFIFQVYFEVSGFWLISSLTIFSPSAINSLFIILFFFSWKGSYIFYLISAYHRFEIWNNICFKK